MMVPIASRATVLPPPLKTEIKGNKLLTVKVQILGQLVATISTIQRKRGLVIMKNGLLQNFRGQ
jgi:hypothetical protein